MQKIDDKYMREASSAIADVQSLDNDNDLIKLESILIKLRGNSISTECMLSFLGIFERFPSSDGYGICWNILHLLESQDDYTLHLVESAKRSPSVFGIMMIGRLLNYGVQNIGQDDLRELLLEISGRTAIDNASRNEAKGWIEQINSDT